MPRLLKYIFFLFLFLTVTIQTDAKKNKQKSKSTISSIKKKIVVQKKGKGKKKNNITKNKSAKNKSKKNNIVKRYKIKDEVIPVQEIVNQSSLDIPVLKDTTPSKVVTIISSFKPQLKNIVKINFTNASPIIDTQTTLYTYQIPGQNLQFSYRPIALNPLAISIEDKLEMKGKSNIKVGFGNYLYQYINGNFISSGPNSIHHFSILNESSEGIHHLQKYRNLKFDYRGNHSISENNTLITNLFASQQQSFRYGLVPDTLDLPKNNYEQKFSNIGINIALLNKNIFSQIQYNPVLVFDHVKDIQKSSNLFMSISSPISHTFKSGMKINFDVLYSYSVYNGTKKSANSLFRIDPSLSFDKWKLKLLFGMSPVSKSDGFKLYPNIQLQQNLKDTNWSFKAGWRTITTNTNYSNLLKENPWIASPISLKITTQEKQYFKLVNNFSKRLQYGAGISLNKYVNLPLYIREPLAIFDSKPGQPNFAPNSNWHLIGLRYLTTFETLAKTIELEANVRYQFSDLFSIDNQFVYTQFNFLEDNEKPWGYVPLQLNSTFHWSASENLLFDGSANLLSGIESPSENASYIGNTLKSALILNAGLQYKISKPWMVWVKANNLLSKQYQRWGDYPSLGVQINAGVVYSFGK